jgi:ParB-like nuclease domain
MRLPWSKSKADQLELLDADPEPPCESSVLQARPYARSPAPPRSSKTAAEGDVSGVGRPLLVPVDRLSEDPNNPRIEFPDAEIEELAESIRQHGILQPLVGCPPNHLGHYRIHDGAKRSRAAGRPERGARRGEQRAG